MEGFHMFVEMQEQIKREVVSFLYRMEVVTDIKEREMNRRQKVERQLDAMRGPEGPVKRKKIGRNDPCPCGSGKKYKKCCGA